EQSRTPPAGVSPEWWVEAASRHGYDVEVRWLRGASDGTLDLLFVRRDAKIPGWSLGPLTETAAATGSRDINLRLFASNPLHGMLADWAIPALRTHLEERLPAYMVPPTILLLDRLALLPNGKVDRSALPAPAHSARSGQGGYTAPRNAVE